MISYERLHEVLHYDPETGVFKWKKYGRGRNKDLVAGTKTKYGYIRINIDGNSYMAHRLAWLYTDGYSPENDIDHKNRVRDDNRRINLREVSRSCNMHNAGLRSDSISGITGVHYFKRTNKWTAEIKINGEKHYLGYFSNKIDAAKARWYAEKKYNFPNCNTTSSAYEYIKKHEGDA